jgi:hypothetical protein
MRGAQWDSPISSTHNTQHTNNTISNERESNTRRQKYENDNQTNPREAVTIPSEIPNVIVGDSILRDIRPQKLDRDQQTRVKTMRGKKIRDVTRYLQSECPSVKENLVVHVGTNDLQRNPSNIERNIRTITEDFEELAETFLRTMPSKCQLTISGILQRNDIDCQTIDTINSWLETFASHNSRISFSHSNRIDNHPKSLVDGLHLSDIGTRMLCKKFINTIRPRAEHRNDYNEYNRFTRNDRLR